MASVFSEYSVKPAGDNQLRKHIIVYNQYNEIVFSLNMEEKWLDFSK